MQNNRYLKYFRTRNNLNARSADEDGTNNRCDYTPPITAVDVIGIGETSSPFHGWWKTTTSGHQSGFSITSPIRNQVDQYIFIDTLTLPYPTIRTVFGTLKYPRTATPLDSFNFPVPQFFFQSATELVNIADYNGPNANVFVFYSAPTLKLLSNTRLAATFFSQAHYLEQHLYQVYEKMPEAPRLTSLLDYNDPVNLIKYMKDFYDTIVNKHTNRHLHDRDYVGPVKRDRLYCQFLGDGFCKTTPIRKIRITNPANAIALGLVDRVTDILTGDPIADTGEFSFATPGSTVVLQGFQGALSPLNGTYVNGVLVLEGGAIPNPRSKFLDSGAGGSFNDHWQRFLLNFDSSAPQFQQLADPRTGLVCVPPGATITVTHRIRSDMEYPAFIAAIHALFYATLKVVTHHAWFQYCRSNSFRMIDTWVELKTRLAQTPTGLSLRSVVARRGKTRLSHFYHSPTVFLGSNQPVLILLNDPYAIRPVTGGIFDYPVDMRNYLINPKNLYFGFEGVLQADQPDPVLFGYPPVRPGTGTGRAHFVSAIGDIKVDGNGRAVLAAGRPQAGTNVPDPTYFRIVGQDTQTVAVAGAEYFFGQIDPRLTAGKVVGYLFLADFGFIDIFGLMATGLYSPDTQLPPSNTTNPRNQREAASQVYSVMMKYFNDLGCQSIIIDIRANLGGSSPAALSLAEFFGDDRRSQVNVTVPVYDDCAPLVDINSDSITVNDANRIGGLKRKFTYVGMNRSKYPGSVFNGTPGNPKQVILLTDLLAFSTADLFPWFFIGEKLDRNIGGNVNVTILGDIDGRLKGAVVISQSMPVNTFNPYLVSATGLPVSPFQTQEDFTNSSMYRMGVTNHYSVEQVRALAPDAAPTLCGTGGKNPLPNSHETTIWPDFGFITPHPDPLLPGWTYGNPNPLDNSTWRDRWLEQAILTAKLSIMAPLQTPDLVAEPVKWLEDCEDC